MNLIRIEDYRKMYREGTQYLQTAVRAHACRRDIFTPEILYNLAAMAIEKFFMSFLMYNCDMADNHTMRDLIDSVHRHADLDRSLEGRLLYLDTFQQICDLDGFSITSPAEKDIPTILETAAAVKEFVDARITGHRDGRIYGNDIDQTAGDRINMVNPPAG